MKHLYLFAVTAALAFAIYGCGGSGTGTGGSTTGGDVPPPGTPVVEAVQAPGGIVPSDPATFVAQDPLNIETNQQLAFQLVAYAPTGERVVLSADNWRSSDTASAYGRLAANSGLFAAGNQATTSILYAGVRYQGVDYYTAYSVKPHQATITGQILTAAGGSPAKGVGILFYDASGTVTGRTSQPWRGSFRASVPVNTVAFQIDSDTLPNIPGQPQAYQRFFTFNTLVYATSNDFCRPPLSSLNVGTNSLGGSITLISASAPPASETGCGL